MDLTLREKIKPFCIAPWMTGAEVTIMSREEAIRSAPVTEQRPQEGQDVLVFTDGSTRNGLSGMEAAFGNGRPLFHRTIGKAGPNQLAELRAIHYTVMLIERVTAQVRHIGHNISIFSDCQSALKALARPCHQ